MRSAGNAKRIAEDIQHRPVGHGSGCPRRHKRLQEQHAGKDERQRTKPVMSRRTQHAPPQAHAYHEFSFQGNAVVLRLNRKHVKGARKHRQSRAETQSCPPYAYCCYVACCCEVGCELVISCGDAPPIFQAAECAFDDVSALVGLSIEWLDLFSRCRCAWCDGLRCLVARLKAGTGAGTLPRRLDRLATAVVSLGSPHAVLSGRILPGSASSRLRLECAVTLDAVPANSGTAFSPNVVGAASGHSARTSSSKMAVTRAFRSSLFHSRRHFAGSRRKARRGMLTGAPGSSRQISADRFGSTSTPSTRNWRRGSLTAIRSPSRQSLAT